MKGPDMHRDAKTERAAAVATPLGLCANLTLALLLAEMKALEAMMPGLAPEAPKPTEAEIEAGFDNMPV